MIGRKWFTPWLWLLPALSLLGVFLVYPIGDTIRRSLFDKDSGPGLLDNYRFVFTNPLPILADTHAALLNNLLWIVLLPGVTVSLGLIIAVLTNRVRYEAVAKALIFVPMAVSFVAAAVIWKFMYDFAPPGQDQIGVVNAVITGLGADPIPWLNRDAVPFVDADLPTPLNTNNFALILVGIWIWTGFAMVILSAGLKGISQEIIEAARVDGANEWQTFWRVILPMLSTTIVVVATTLVINALKIFDLVWVMGRGGGADVVSTLFVEMLGRSDFGRGAALAVILLAAVLPIMFLTIRRFRTQEEMR